MPDINGLRYPAAGAVPDVPSDIRNLAEDVDEREGAEVVTSSSRPASGRLGQRVYETDTGNTRIWNGTRWAIMGTFRAASLTELNSETGVVTGQPATLRTSTIRAEFVRVGSFWHLVGPLYADTVADRDLVFTLESIILNRGDLWVPTASGSNGYGIPFMNSNRGWQRLFPIAGGFYASATRASSANLSAIPSLGAQGDIDPITISGNSIVVPERGMWKATATMQFAANATGARVLQLQRGGTVIATDRRDTPNVGHPVTLTVAETRLLNGGETYEVWYLQNSGAGLSCQTWFTLEKIGIA